MPSLALSQQPDALNLNLRQYQEWALTFSFCNNDAEGNYDLNLPIDLSGYTPIIQFRTNAMARTAVLTFTVENGALTFVPDTCPQVQVSAGINCPPGKYVWDLRCVPNDETESIFLGQGTVIVSAEVSR